MKIRRGILVSIILCLMVSCGNNTGPDWKTVSSEAVNVELIKMGVSDTLLNDRNYVIPHRKWVLQLLTYYQRLNKDYVYSAEMFDCDDIVFDFGLFLSKRAINYENRQVGGMIRIIFVGYVGLTNAHAFFATMTDMGVIVMDPSSGEWWEIDDFKKAHKRTWQEGCF